LHKSVLIFRFGLFQNTDFFVSVLSETVSKYRNKPKNYFFSFVKKTETERNRSNFSLFRFKPKQKIVCFEDTLVQDERKEWPIITDFTSLRLKFPSSSPLPPPASGIGGCTSLSVPSRLDHLSGGVEANFHRIGQRRPATLGRNRKLGLGRP
jgi:hypothetical protein